MDADAYSAAKEFVKELKQLDPEFYREVTLLDVLPYFDKLARKIDKLNISNF